VAPQRGKPVVAVIFDFDDTLAPDNTSQLLESLGIDVPKFWHNEVGPLVRSGWVKPVSRIRTPAPPKLRDTFLGL
jgi:hypothetical protein